MEIKLPVVHLPPLRVGLLWHSVNSDNLGVTALTAANIDIVSENARQLHREVQFVVLGWADAGKQQISAENIEVFAMRAKDFINPQGLYAQVRRCNIVLDISAGDSFADIYGARRFLFNVIAKSVVVLARRPLVMSPQTLGPFQRWWAKIAARFFLNRAAAVVTRDSLSTALARSYNVGSVVEATDVAFRLPYTQSEKSAGKPRVGLNISGLLFNGGYTRNNMFGLKDDYPTLSRLIISRLLSENCELHLVSHVISEKFETEDDYRVALALAKDFPSVVVAPKFKTPSEAKSYISGLDFFAGSRMHACIAAFSSGVPVVPIAYSRKFIGVFGSLGYTEVADCATQSAEQISDMVLQGFSNREALKQQVLQSNALAQKRLETYSDILRSFLRDPTA